MPSLSQILATHGTALVLDAASSRVQTGWLEAGGQSAWTAKEQEAGLALFRGIEQLRGNPANAGAFIFCEGPGSILGIRTAAAAIRTWTVLRGRPVYAYQSLDLVARALGQSDTTVIADARRQLWHAQVCDQPLRRVPLAELTGPLVMPAGFRHWSEPPTTYASTPYELPELFQTTIELDIFHPCAEPDAFMHSEPEYKTWTPQIHRAP